MPFRYFRTPNAGDGSRRRPPRRLTKRDWLAGTIVELDPEANRLTLRVDSGSRPIPARGTEVEIDTGDARFQCTDGDGDGRQNLTDLFPGDEVIVDRLRHTGGRWAAARVTQRSIGAPKAGLRLLYRT